MSYDDIIAKIKSDLTGNTDKDKAYLIKQFNPSLMVPWYHPGLKRKGERRLKSGKNFPLSV